MKKIEVCKKTKRKRVKTINEEKSLTDQSWKVDCDVNHVMSKFMKTGQISHLAKVEGQYADVSGIQCLHDSLTVVAEAESAFNMLPAKLRKKFSNSMVKMDEYLRDPKNNEEAIKLGLKKPGPKPVSAGAGGSHKEVKDAGVSKGPSDSTDRQGSSSSK